METLMPNTEAFPPDISDGGADAVPSSGSTVIHINSSQPEYSGCEASDNTTIDSTVGTDLSRDLHHDSTRDGKTAPQNDRHKLSLLSHSERYLLEVAEGRLPPSTPYDVRVSAKAAAKLRWDASLKLAEVLQMSGKFWSKFGFSINKRDFLFPEEALYLAEKGSVYAVPSSDLSNTDATASSGVNKPPTEAIPLRELYATVMQCVPLPLYLAYVKLKDLDYVVTRFRKSLHLLDTYDDLVRAGVDTPLLHRSASFSVYLPDTWSKKAAAKVNASTATASKQKQSPAPIFPVAYVIVTTAPTIPPAPVLLRLLDEAARTPIIFAVVAKSGHVSLTEFSDALLCLDWTSGMRRGAGKILEKATLNGITTGSDIAGNKRKASIIIELHDVRGERASKSVRGGGTVCVCVDPRHAHDIDVTVTFDGHELPSIE